MPAKPQQTTSHILMIRPANFGFNEQTAQDNAFQQDDSRYSSKQIRERAIEEFDAFAQLLQLSGVNVILVNDTKSPRKTDAVFPNNWVSFHEDGTVVTYPMFAPTRRKERREEVIALLAKRFQIERRMHLEKYESEQKFLESTGSMVLDRQHKIAYACRSDRTDEGPLAEFCETLGYEQVVFNAADANRVPVYHTNVMMALGETFAIICLDTISDAKERKMVRQKLEQTGKAIISITMAQLHAFAGNMLQVRNRSGDPLLVMSQQAYESLNKDQIYLLHQHTNLLYSPLEVIELYGGGSARCMMAEVFLPER